MGELGPNTDIRWSRCHFQLDTARHAHGRRGTRAHDRTNYRIYDDRVGETTRFTYRPDHEWYWFPQQKPNEVSMLKCYDSLADGSV